MVAPDEIPVTRPEVIPTDTADELALHVPPVPPLNVCDVPTHTFELPLISEGSGSTDTVTPPVVVQPAELVAVTLYMLLPVADGMIVGDAHVPHDSPLAPEIPTHANVAPGAIAVKLVDEFRQMAVAVEGEILSIGNALTVIFVTAEQPEPKVYDIAAVPAATPVTRPDEFTVATAVFELVQVPPETLLPSNAVPPSHT